MGLRLPRVYERNPSGKSSCEDDMRKGFTTGTAAAAAAKAAAMLLVRGRKRCPAGYVEIPIPGNKRLRLRVHSARLLDQGPAPLATASVVKDAGGDPDVTDGLEIVARVKRLGSTGDIEIRGGEGVGVVTRPGLQVPVGEPAINPVPREMIREAVREVLPEAGVEVEISVPEGRRIAAKTFNQRLGIVGGISIIGTTGIVEPMSIEALKATIRCEIDVAWEEIRHSRSPLFLAPGRIGEDALKRLFGDIRVVQMSNFAGVALEYAREKGVSGIVLGGHPGKLAKILMGHLDTHSARSPQAAGFVAGFLGLDREFNTVEEIIQALGGNPGRKQAFSGLASAVAGEVKEGFGFDAVEVCLFDMKKELIGRGRCTG